MSEGGLGDSARYLPRLRLDELLAEPRGAPHGPACGPGQRRRPLQRRNRPRHWRLPRQPALRPGPPGPDQRRLHDQGRRTHARALGYGAHFINGQIFALLYYAVFAAIGYSSWWLGTVFGSSTDCSPPPRSSTSCCPSFTHAWAHPRPAHATSRTTRTTRLFYAQLRPQHTHRHPRSAPRLRNHHRRLPRVARLTTPSRHRSRCATPIGQQEAGRVAWNPAQETGEEPSYHSRRRKGHP